MDDQPGGPKADEPEPDAHPTPKALLLTSPPEGLLDVDWHDADDEEPDDDDNGEVVDGITEAVAEMTDGGPFDTFFSEGDDGSLMVLVCFPGVVDDDDGEPDDEE